MHQVSVWPKRMWPSRRVQGSSCHSGLRDVLAGTQGPRITCSPVCLINGVRAGVGSGSATLVKASWSLVAGGRETSSINDKCAA